MVDVNVVRGEGKMKGKLLSIIKIHLVIYEFNPLLFFLPFTGRVGAGMRSTRAVFKGSRKSPEI